MFDIITTQYALSTYPHLSEGNPIMAMVTSSFALFVLVKAIGVLFIVNIYKRIRARSELASKVGQIVIIMMMLFVVGNNIIQIASATTTYGIITPNTLEYPAQLDDDGGVVIPFLISNGTTIQRFLPDPDVAGSISSLATVLVTNSTNTILTAALDWTNPNRVFAVDSQQDVFYFDSNTQVNLSLGFYTAGIWPITCSNCNPVYKIGTISAQNPHFFSLVDSNGNYIVRDNKLVISSFIAASDYAKTTFLTVSTGHYIPHGASTSIISDMAFDEDGNIHLLIGGDVGYLQHLVYNGVNKALIYNQSLYTTSGLTYNSDILISDNATRNKTTDIIYSSYNTANVTVILRYLYNNISNDICPAYCGVISTANGLGIFGSYAYILASTENKVYRFPTNVSTLSGSGFIAGVGAESTDVPDITYTEKSINSLYANYYNTSKFSIQAKINFPSGNWPTSANYGINDQAYRWQIKLVDPNGVTVNSWDSGECDDSGLTHCELTILREYSPPSIGWQAGTWYVKLYEHKIDSTVFGDAPSGNLALLTTSATWNVLNSSTNITGTISDPVESISSPSSLATISLIDGYVSLMGFGVNGVSKFLFALVWAVMLFVVGLYFAKSGMIGLALSSLPYTFFAYIGYVPKWVFITYIILLVIISRVFR